MANNTELAFKLAGKIELSVSSTFMSAVAQMKILQSKVSSLRTDIRGLEVAQKKGKVSTEEYAASYAKLSKQLLLAQQARQKLVSATAAPGITNAIAERPISTAAMPAVDAGAFALPAEGAIRLETAMSGITGQLAAAREEAIRLAQAIGQIGMTSAAAQKDMTQGTQGTVFSFLEAQLPKTFAMLQAGGISSTNTAKNMDAVIMPTLQDMSNQFAAVTDRVAAFAAEHPALASLAVRWGAGLVIAAEGIKTVGDGLQSVSDTWNSYDAGNKALSEMSKKIEEMGLKTRIGAAATSLWTRVVSVFNATLLANPIILVAATVIALVAAGYLLYKNWATISAYLGTAWESIKQGISSLYQSVVSCFQGIYQGIVMWLQQAYQGAVTWIGNACSAVLAFVVGLPAKIAFGIGYAVGWISTLPERTYYYMTLMWNYAVTFATQTATAIYDALAGGITNAITWLATLPQSVGTFMFDTYNAMITWIGMAVTETVAYFVSLPEQATVALSTFWANVEAWASGVYTSVVNWFLQIPGAITGAFNTAVQFVDNIKNKLQNLGNILGINFSAGVAAGSQLPGHATGGIFDIPHIAWFAENGPEAAIPLDGSARALSLWAQAGSMLGVRSGGSGGGSPMTVTYAPTINAGGANTNELEQILQRGQDNFAQQLERLMNNERRLSYA